MSLFKYRALDAQGVAQNGTLEARDQDAAIAALQKRGLMVLQVDVAGLGGLRRVLGSGLLNGAALVSFTQQLATLLGAGNRWNDLLESCSNSLDNRRPGR